MKRILLLNICLDVFVHEIFRLHMKQTDVFGLFTAVQNQPEPETPNLHFQEESSYMLTLTAANVFLFGGFLLLHFFSNLKQMTAPIIFYRKHRKHTSLPFAYFLQRAAVVQN